MKVITMAGVCAAVFLLTMPVHAQEQESNIATNDTSHRHDTAADVVATLKTQLSLTDDQVAAITPVIEKYIAKRQELRQSVQDGTLDKGNMHTQFEQLREEENQELSQILSQDQMSQWSNMQNHQHRHTAGGSGSSSGGGE